MGGARIASNNSRTAVKWLIGAYAVLGLAVLLTVFLIRNRDFHARLIFLDPLSIARVPTVTGLFSNVGILIWASSAAICLIAWIVFLSGDRDLELKRFFLTSWLLLTLFTVDDLFTLHDQIFSKLFLIPERVTEGVYAAIVLWFVFRFRHRLMGSPHRIALISGGFLLAFSVTIDTTFDPTSYFVPMQVLVEEMAKLLGVASLLVFFSLFARDSLLSLIGSSAEARSESLPRA